MQYMNIIFVCNEELKGGMQGYLLCLLDNQQKFQPQLFRCNAGPRSAVGNVSGYRCVSDCRSRGREFDPGPVPYFRGD